MKKILVALFLIFAVAGFWLSQKFIFAAGKISSSQNTEDLQQVLKNGDIIFQVSRSGQSKAIQLATKSQYSHMGIIYENADGFFVYEAVQPVKLTRLKEWIDRGENGHYVVKRLKNADEILTQEKLQKMRTAGEEYAGKDYDIFFEWNDEKIYCSELVYKIYKEAAGIEIGKIEKLSDFDLSHKMVQAKMKERFGDKIPPDEKVISPASMFEDEDLFVVIKN